MRISVRAFCSNIEQNTHRDKDWIHETPGSVLHSVGMKCLDPSASRRERRTSIPVSQDSVFSPRSTRSAQLSMFRDFAWRDALRSMCRLDLFPRSVKARRRW